MNGPAKGNAFGKETVVTNMGRGMDPMSAYERAERREHRERMERLRGAKPDRRGGR